MISNSIHGAALSFIPAISDVRATEADYDLVADDIVISNNEFYLFTGAMPAREILVNYATVAEVLAAHDSNKVFEYKGFSLKYTFDKTRLERVIQKDPVDAIDFTSAVDGTATWAMILCKPKSLTSTDEYLLFTNAVGGWDDVDQSILVSNTTVTVGGAITLKDISLTIQDSLVIDL